MFRVSKTHDMFQTLVTQIQINRQFYTVLAVTNHADQAARSTAHERLREEAARPEDHVILLSHQILRSRHAGRGMRCGTQDA